MTRTNVYLTKQQLERLRSEAEKTGLSVAELVRRAIDAYLTSIKPTRREKR